MVHPDVPVSLYCLVPYRRFYSSGNSFAQPRDESLHFSSLRTSLHRRSAMAARGKAQDESCRRVLDRIYFINFDIRTGLFWILKPWRESIVERLHKSYF